MTTVVGIVNHPARDPDKLITDTEADVILTDHKGSGPGVMHHSVLCELERFLSNPLKNWLVVLEDDAEVVPEFRQELVACLDYAPQPLVSLYLGTGYPAQYQRRFAEAVATGIPWILHKQLRHAVGYCISRDIAADLMDHTADLTQQGWAMDDAITAYLRRTPFLTAYCNPSMVDHKDGRSVITQRTHLGRATFGRKRPRRAHRYGLPLTWTDKSVLV